MRILSVIFSLSIALLTLFPVDAGAQAVRKDTVLVHFYQGWSRISPALKENRRALDSIAHIVKNYSRDPRFRMHVTGWASPEGVSTFNLTLSYDRAAAIRSYIEERAGLRLPDTGVTLTGMGIDWNGLDSSLVRSEDFAGRNEVLSIIRTVPIWHSEGGKVTGGRKKALMELEGGEVYEWLTLNHFAPLRRAEIILEYVPMPSVEAVPAHVSEVAALDDRKLPSPPSPEHIPLHRLALKTNLLYDAILMPSLEIEYLINSRWSIAAHSDVAWWSKDSEHRYYQIAAIYPEARWWFHTRNPWHGHYLGLFAGGSWYDLENGGRGYKGEGGFIGLSYGYMFPISRSLSFEVGLGAGYMFTRYEEYLPVPYMGGTHYVYQQTSQMHYFGPLKVKFAFVWRLWDADYNKRKKGGAA